LHIISSIQRITEKTKSAITWTPLVPSRRTCPPADNASAAVAIGDPVQRRLPPSGFPVTSTAYAWSLPVVSYTALQSGVRSAESGWECLGSLLGFGSDSKIPSRGWNGLCIPTVDSSFSRFFIRRGGGSCQVVGCSPPI